MTITLNERQIKALKALKHKGGVIEQSRYNNDSAAWFLSNRDIWRLRLNLTCRDVYQLGHLGLGFLSEPMAGYSERSLTDKGRQYLEEIK